MGYSYNKLWKLLIDKNMMKTDLQKAVGMSPTTLAKMGKNETVNMNLLAKICEYLKCDIDDILSYHLDSKLKNSGGEIYRWHDKLQTKD